MPGAEPSATRGDTVLTVRNVSKNFLGTQALDGVDFDLLHGEIHALVGQNGSGKSTLIKILAGYHHPDPGAVIELDGLPIEPHDTAASRAAGFRFVHQDLALVPSMNTVENLALGRGYITRRLGRIDWRAERRDAQQRMGELGYEFDVRLPVSEIAASERTGVAIARALSDSADARVLVMDEPTASMPRDEVRVLFGALNRVREKGTGVIYVSHRLDEVFEIAQRVTVLRDGRKLGTFTTEELDEDGLVTLIAGGAGPERPRSAATFSGGSGVPALEVRGLCGVVVDNVDLTVAAGEVLGVAGLTGSGREEVLPLIFGARSRHGLVTVQGRPVPASVNASIGAGVAFVPPNRHAEGSITLLTVRENLSLTGLERLTGRFDHLRRSAERGETSEWIQKLDVRPPTGDAVFATLSGGNQQKVVMAKWLRGAPGVLLLDEPTQGVDVHAKATIHGFARDAADRGAAVVVASSDDIELCEMCDRVVVFRDGRIAGEIQRERLDPEELARLQLSTRPVPASTSDVSST